MSKPFSESVYECGKCCKVLWRVRRLEKRHCTYNAGPFIIVCTVFKVKTLHQGQTAPSYSIKPRPISNNMCLILLDLDFYSALHQIVIMSPKYTQFALIKVRAFIYSLRNAWKCQRDHPVSQCLRKFERIMDPHETFKGSILGCDHPPFCGVWWRWLYSAQGTEMMNIKWPLSYLPFSMSFSAEI